MKIRIRYAITTDGRFVYIIREDNRSANESTVPHISGVYRWRETKGFIMFFYRDNDGQ